MAFLDRKTMLPSSLFAFLISVVINSPSESFIIPNDRIYFLLYTRECKFTPDIATRRKEIVNFEHFNSSNPTVFFIDEFQICSNVSYNYPEIMNAYLKKNACNFIAVDWSEFKNPYPPSERHVYKKVAYHVAEFLYEMHDNQMISLSQLHIIGFGIGAYIAAEASKNLRQFAAPKIKRITGLNPVIMKPNRNIVIAENLDKSSAKYVDIIYTARNFSFENEKPRGHVDFYANFAQIQATCGHDFCCKHNYAWKYYMYSVNNPHKYRAQLCDFGHRGMVCKIVNDQYMGIASNSKKLGLFYVEIPRRLSFEE